jgi:hypothetical protein
MIAKSKEKKGYKADCSSSLFLCAQILTLLFSSVAKSITGIALNYSLFIEAPFFNLRSLVFA